MTDVRPLRAVAEVTLGKMRTPDGDAGTNPVPYLRAANVSDGSLRLDDVKTMHFEPAELERHRLRPGDVLVTEASGSRDQVGQTALYQGEVPGAAMQNTLLRLRPRPGMDARYLYWWSRFAFTSGLYAEASQGLGIWHLGSERMQRLPVPVLPIEEQRRVSAFLDDKIELLDSAISLRQQQAELLVIRRASFAWEELTGASVIAPRAEGTTRVPWLDSIPNHWRVLPLRYVCRITTGVEDSGNATDDGAYPFYVRGRQILRIDSYSFDGEAVMTPGDGQGGVGKVFHYATGRFQAHQRVYVFLDFRGVTGRFFLHSLSTWLPLVALAGGNKVTMESLRRPMLTGLPIPVPPLPEQRDIARRLDAHDEQYTKLAEQYQESMRLLDERKRALITLAVTGQLDVAAASASVAK